MLSPMLSYVKVNFDKVYFVSRVLISRAFCEDYEDTETSYTPCELAFNVITPKDVCVEKNPVIFLHGLTSSKECWSDIPETVAHKTKRKVYVLDARDHGDSPWTDSFSFSSNAKDLRHFMDTHNISKAILVGHSMGGFSAMILSIMAPERVEKLVIEDMGVRNTFTAAVYVINLQLNLWLAGLQQVPPGVDELTAKEIIHQYVYDRLPSVIQAHFHRDRIDHEHIRLKLSPEGRYQFRSNLSLLERVSRNFPHCKNLEGTYEGPACFIYGTKSPFQIGDQEEEIRTYYPNAKLVPMQDARHSIHNEIPREFTNTLLEFMMQ